LPAVLGGHVRLTEVFVCFGQLAVQVVVVRLRPEGGLQVGERFLPPLHLDQDRPSSTPTLGLIRPALNRLIDQFQGAGQLGRLGVRQDPRQVIGHQRHLGSDPRSLLQVEPGLPWLVPLPGGDPEGEMDKLGRLSTGKQGLQGRQAPLGLDTVCPDDRNQAIEQGRVGGIMFQALLQQRQPIAETGLGVPTQGVRLGDIDPGERLMVEGVFPTGQPLL